VNGDLTLLDNATSKGKATATLIKGVNPNTRRDTKGTDFSEPNWGKSTHEYFESIDKNLRVSSFDKILHKAQEMASKKCYGGGESVDTDAEIDCAELLDLSDDDGDHLLVNLTVYSLLTDLS
jgi:hypothetical protein